MTAKTDYPSKAVVLRKRAEKQAGTGAAEMPETLPLESAQDTLHELRVHQIELEIQNEELRRTYVELEASRARFIDLYDQAPVGYLTLSRDDLVLEANLTAAGLLGVARGALAGRPLTRFILPEDQDTYYRYRKALRGTGTTQVCELRMIRAEDTPFWAYIEAIDTMKNGDRETTCRVAISDITERKSAEEDLKVINVVLTTQQEVALDGILVVDENGKILSSNRRFAEMWGVSSDIIESKSGERALQSVMDKLSDPEEFSTKVRDLYANRHERSRGEIALKDGGAFERYSAPMFGPDGKYDGRVWYFRDITDRKKAEDEVRESEARYRVLFEAGPDGILITDVEEKAFRHANAAVCRLLGYTREELETMAVWDIHPKDALPQVAAAFESQARGETTLAMAMPCMRKDGTILYADVNATAVTLDGRQCLVGFFRDITERLVMESQLRQSQRLKSIGTLASGVAHEINNPVMGIMNYAQLILDKLGPDSEVAEFAVEICKETERVAAIVKNLLSFSRYDKQTRGPARMHDIVESTLSLIRAGIRHDQIRLEADIPEYLPVLKCRSQQIQQVVMNLLTNARDALNEKYHGHDDNKVIRIGAKMMERDGKDWIRTTVEDHGTGISEKVLESLFDPFYTTKPRDKGTGLGLSISHGIIKEHNGELSVETELGGWTRFHMDLPVDNE